MAMNNDKTFYFSLFGKNYRILLQFFRLLPSQSTWSCLVSASNQPFPFRDNNLLFQQRICHSFLVCGHLQVQILSEIFCLMVL